LTPFRVASESLPSRFRFRVVESTAGARGAHASGRDHCAPARPPPPMPPARGSRPIPPALSPPWWLRGARNRRSAPARPRGPPSPIYRWQWCTTTVRPAHVPLPLARVCAPDCARARVACAPLPTRTGGPACGSARNMQASAALTRFGSLAQAVIDAPLRTRAMPMQSESHNVSVNSVHADADDCISLGRSSTFRLCAFACCKHRCVFFEVRAEAAHNWNDDARIDPLSEASIRFLRQEYSRRLLQTFQDNGHIHCIRILYARSTRLAKAVPAPVNRIDRCSSHVSVLTSSSLPLASNLRDLNLANKVSNTLVLLHICSPFIFWNQCPSTLLILLSPAFHVDGQVGCVDGRDKRSIPKFYCCLI
jgi:hypothetical protein